MNKVKKIALRVGVLFFLLCIIYFLLHALLWGKTSISIHPQSFNLDCKVYIDDNEVYSGEIAGMGQLSVPDYPKIVQLDLDPGYHTVTVESYSGAEILKFRILVIFNHYINVSFQCYEQQAECSASFSNALFRNKLFGIKSRNISDVDIRVVD